MVAEDVLGRMPLLPQLRQGFQLQTGGQLTVGRGSSAIIPADVCKAQPKGIKTNYAKNVIWPINKYAEIIIMVQDEDCRSIRDETVQDKRVKFKNE